jgi:hypothetical protein
MVSRFTSIHDSWPVALRPRVVALLLLVFCLLAGEARADSIFNQSYFGGVSSMTDARGEGRGGANLGFTDSLNANVGIPTQLLDLRRVTFSLTSNWGSTNSKDEYGSVKRFDIANPTLRVGMPLGPNLAFGTGFVARRSAQWTLVRDAAASPDPNAPAQETLEREGTLFDFPFELGAQLHRNLRAGVGLLLTRGTLRQRYSAVVPGAGANPADVREDVFSGEAAKFALGLYDVGPVTVTGFYVPQYGANVNIQVSGVSKDSRRDDHRVDTLPARIGVGTRIDLPGRLSWGGDYRREYWSKYEGRQSYEGQLQDEWSIHTGLELEERGLGRRRKAPWRVGYWYRSWNYSLMGERVTEWATSVGTSLRLLGPYSRADVALQYGRIGSMDRNGASESFFRLVVSITGGEKWY